MTLTLVKPFKVIGVDHTEKGLPRALRCLHAGAPVSEVQILNGGIVMVNDILDVDPRAPSKCKGMKVGLEVGADELAQLQERIEQKRDVPKTDDFFFWHIVLSYCKGEGLHPVAIDNSEMKREYLRLLEESERLRTLGKLDEAQTKRDKAYELWIPEREHWMANEIIREDTQVSLVGRFHPEAIVEILRATPETIAYPIMAAGALGEFMNLHGIGMQDQLRARIRYAQRQASQESQSS